MNDIYDFIDNVLIYFNIKKEDKHNFIDENIVNNYKINTLISN